MLKRGVQNKGAWGEMTSIRKMFTAIGLSHTLIHVCSNAHIALIPVLMIEFELSLFETSIIATVPFLCSIFGSPIGGYLSDRIKPTYVIGMSLLLGSIGTASVYLAPNSGILIGSFALLSFASAVYHPPAYALTSEMYSERRNTALGLLGATGILGMSIGPISIGILLTTFGWRLIYFLWTLPIFVVAILLIILTYNRVPKVTQLNIGKSEEISTSGDQKSSALFLNVMIFISLVSMGKMIIGTYFTTYLVLGREIPESLAITLFGVMGIIGMMSSPGGGFLADKLGEKKYLTIAYIAIASLLLAFFFAQEFSIIIILMMVYGFFRSSDMGVTATLVAYTAPTRKRGAAYGIFFIPPQVIGAIAPIVAAYVAEQTGISNIFLLSIIFFILAILVLQKINLEGRREITL